MYEYKYMFLTSSGVPMMRGFSLCLSAPSDKFGSPDWKTHIFPPMFFMTVKAALRAGPRQDSDAAEVLNMEGRPSRKASTTGRLSLRFTSRSSGRGMKSSLRSLTTSICGCVRFCFML